jgi:hypothetical protein
VFWPDEASLGAKNPEFSALAGLDSNDSPAVAPTTIVPINLRLELFLLLIMILKIYGYYLFTFILIY